MKKGIIIFGNDIAAKEQKVQDIISNYKENEIAYSTMYITETTKLFLLDGIDSETELTQFEDMAYSGFLSDTESECRPLILLVFDESVTDESHFSNSTGYGIDFEQTFDGFKYNLDNSSIGDIHNSMKESYDSIIIDYSKEV